MKHFHSYIGIGGVGREGYKYVQVSLNEHSASQISSLFQQQHQEQGLAQPSPLLGQQHHL